MTTIHFNQSTNTDTAYVNAAITDNQLTIRMSRNEEAKGAIVLAMPIADAVALAEAILAQARKAQEEAAYDEFLASQAPDRYWYHDAVSAHWGHD